MAMSFAYFTPAEADQYAFYRIPKMLIKDKRFSCLSTEAKLLYGLLLDRVSLSLRNGWVDKQNHVYIVYTIEQIMDDMNCCNKKAIAILKELETKVHLIEKKRQGLGKPNLIYVKNFFCQCMGSGDDEVSVDAVDNFSAEMEKGDVNVCKKDTSEGEINSSQMGNKVHCNNTDMNKTEKSNTNLILSTQMGSDEMEEEYEDYRAYFTERLGIDAFAGRSSFEKETVTGLLNLIVDTCCSKKKVTYIGGEAKPTSVVRSRFMKLGMEHIDYVVRCLRENASHVKNIRQYLLTTLYNAPSTITPYHMAWVNHDMAKAG